MERPLYQEWRPDRAQREYSGIELTLDLPGQTYATTHLHDFRAHDLPPRRERQREGWTDRVFHGESHEKATYKWHELKSESDQPLPPPPHEPAPWPVLSYHGQVPSGTRAFRDAIIEQEEVRAWRTQGKVVPERAIYHGEDETKAARAGREPLTRAGSCNPSRAKAPVHTNGPPDWTRKQTGSSYAWPRSGRKVDVKWRQHEKAHQRPPPRFDSPRVDAAAVGRPRDAPELDLALPKYSASHRATAAELVAAGGRGNGVGAVRNRATDFHTTNIKDVLRPESAPMERVKGGVGGSSSSSSSRSGGFQLVSAAEWKRRQMQNARSAMPGGMRDAARDGRPSALPAGVRGWNNPGRGYNTGAGTEPLRMGPTYNEGKGKSPSVESRDPRAPKVAAGVNMWHRIAAARYT